jgi:hypothetical protein
MGAANAAGAARQALTLGPADAAARVSGGNVARPAGAAPHERAAALRRREQSRERSPTWIRAVSASLVLSTDAAARRASIARRRALAVRPMRALGAPPAVLSRSRPRRVRPHRRASAPSSQSLAPPTMISAGSPRRESRTPATSGTSQNRDRVTASAGDNRRRGTPSPPSDMPRCQSSIRQTAAHHASPAAGSAGRARACGSAARPRSTPRHQWRPSARPGRPSRAARRGLRTSVAAIDRETLARPAIGSAPRAVRRARQPSSARPRSVGAGRAPAPRAARARPVDRCLGRPPQP